MTIEDWRSRWQSIGETEASRPWEYGELFIAGREFVNSAPGDDAKTVARAIAKLLPACNLRIQQLREYAYVAATFPPTHRNPRLTWMHHREVWAAGVVGSIQQAQWLSRAETKGWSIRDLRVELAPTGGSDGPRISTTRYVLRRLADQVERALLELFPVGQPANAKLLEQARKETEGMIAQLRRAGLV